jgi:hypothetical protein
MKKPVNKYAAAYPVDSKASYYTNCESSNSTPTTCSTCNTGQYEPENKPSKEEKDGLWWT